MVWQPRRARRACEERRGGRGPRRRRAGVRGGAPTRDGARAAMSSSKRARLEPPDISERGGLKGGEPQRSDARLFMQLLVFTGCDRTADLVEQLRGAPFESVLYEDLNDPRGVALLTLSRDPNTFVDHVRP